MLDILLEFHVVVMLIREDRKKNLNIAQYTTNSKLAGMIGRLVREASHALTKSVSLSVLHVSSKCYM